MSRGDFPEQSARPTHAGADIARFPASRWQRFYWPLAQDPQMCVQLNVAMRWRVLGDFSDAACEAALGRLVARHEILRTRFVEDAEGLSQIVTEHGQVRLARIDLQRLAPDTRNAEAEAIAGRAAREPFDPATPSLMRALVLRVAPSEAILCLTFSRLIVDGWSIGLLVDELARHAAAEIDGGEPPELHYGDFVAWQFQALDGPQAQADAAAWRTRLHAMPSGFTLSSDADLSDPADAIHALPLDDAESAAFDALAVSCGTSPFQLGVALLALVVARISGASDVAMSTEVAGREEPMAEAIVGPLINLLPLSLHCASGDSVHEAIRISAGAVRESLAGEIVPFADLDATPQGRARLPRLHFVLQKSYISADVSADPDYGRFRLISLPSLSTGALWDLNFFMVQRQASWRLSIERRGALFNAATADAFLAYWREVILAAAAAPDGLVADLPAPPPALQRPAIYAPAPARQDLTKPAIVALNIASVYYPLATALAPDIAFHDCPLPDPETPAPQRYFGDIVRDCVDQVRAARPHGPYVVFGFCVAGALALETARALRAQGHDVPLVVMCDTWRPGFRETMKRFDKSLRLMQIRRALWAKHREKLRRGEWTWSYVLRSWPLARRLALADIGEWLGLFREGPADLRIEAENRPLADHLHDSQTRFRPKPYDGEVLIFRSAEVLTGRLFPHALGWADVLTGPFEVIACPGQHDEMFRKEGVAVISAVIRAKLSDLGVISTPEASAAMPANAAQG
jgi:thioesterase domain-containing protein